MSCKWLCRDPKGEAGGVNLTAYCENDPVNGHDPWGLDKWNNTLANEMAEISTPYWFLFPQPPAPPDPPRTFWIGPYEPHPQYVKKLYIDGTSFFELEGTGFRVNSLLDAPGFVPDPPDGGDQTAKKQYYADIGAYDIASRIHKAQGDALTIEIALQLLLPEIAGSIKPSFGRGLVNGPDVFVSRGVRSLRLKDYGLSIDGVPGRTTTIIGNYQMDMARIIREMGDVKKTYVGPNPGGFNILNVPEHLATKGNFWGDYNLPWIREAVIRDDIFIYATTPRFEVLSRINPVTGKVELSGFGKEYLFLRRNGFASALEY